MMTDIAEAIKTETREKIKEGSSKLKAQLGEKLTWGKEKVAEQFSKADRQVDELI